MFEVGQRVRVKAKGFSISASMGGLTGSVFSLSERASFGDLVEVELDGPIADGVAEALVDMNNRCWFNDYELEAVDGSNP